MHDDHAQGHDHNHDAGDGHDTGHGHDAGHGAVAPLEIAWNGIALLALAIAAAAAVGWWASNNKPAPASPTAPIGTTISRPAQFG